MGDAVVGRRMGSLLAIGLMAVGLVSLSAGSARAVEETQTLTVSQDGDGAGSVSTNPAGIVDCRNICSAEFPTGSVVTITQTPLGRSIYGNWSGDCTGSSYTCEVTMDSAKTVQAYFISNSPIPTPGISEPIIIASSKKVKRGRKGTFEVTVINDGDIGIGPTRVCAKFPKRVLSLRPRCREIPGIVDDYTVDFPFKVRWKARRGQKIKVEFTATTAGVEPTRSSTTIRLK